MANNYFFAWRVFLSLTRFNYLFDVQDVIVCFCKGALGAIKLLIIHVQILTIKQRQTKNSISFPLLQLPIIPVNLDIYDFLIWVLLALSFFNPMRRKFEFIMRLGFDHVRPLSFFLAFNGVYWGQ